MRAATDNLSPCQRLFYEGNIFFPFSGKGCLAAIIVLFLLEGIGGENGDAEEIFISSHVTNAPPWLHFYLFFHNGLILACQNVPKCV